MHPRWLDTAWSRVPALILAQLRQGVTPQRLALTIALGVALGLFPILGTTTTLCLLAGLALKLNQPIIQLVNWIVAPLQLVGMYFFMRAGAWLTHAPPLRLSVTAMLASFRDSPLRYAQQLGMSALRGILVWMLLAPALASLLYLLLLPALRRVAARRSRITPRVA
jgi:uncharacterized protein (DUF2062 family)